MDEIGVASCGVRRLPQIVLAFKKASTIHTAPHCQHSPELNTLPGGTKHFDTFRMFVWDGMHQTFLTYLDKTTRFLACDSTDGVTAGSVHSYIPVHLLISL